LNDIVNLKIHIIPSNRNVSAIQDFDQSVDGSNYSEKNSINVNQTADGYSVIFIDTVFKYLDMKVFIGNLIKTFTEKIPNTIFNISIHYHYTTSNCSFDYYDNDTAMKVYELHGIMMMLASSNKMKYVQYSESDTLNQMFDDINDSDDEMNDGSDDMKILSHQNLKHNNISNNKNHNYDETEYVKNILNHYGDYYNEDDENDELKSPFDLVNKSKKKRKKNRYYGESRVFRNAKNPKQIIKKHNLLITKSNSDIKDDIKIIKSFLKDFIPGSSQWKKKFRDELLQRWVTSFVISKKNLKKFSKIYEKQLRNEELDENVSTLATLFQSYQNK